MYNKCSYCFIDNSKFGVEPKSISIQSLGLKIKKQLPYVVFISVKLVLLVPTGTKVGLFDIQSTFTETPLVVSNGL